MLGMMACSRILATAALVGSALAALLGMGFFGVPVEIINAGFMGFNSALAIPALLYFLVPTKKSLISCVLGLFMTLGAQVAFEALFTTWSIPTMVLPFCFAMLPFVALDIIFFSESSLTTELLRYRQYRSYDTSVVLLTTEIRKLWHLSKYALINIFIYY